MPTLTLSDEQVLEMIQQLPFDLKVKIWMLLSSEIRAKRDDWSMQISEDLRYIARQRGLDWDMLDEDARLELVDLLVHEQRECAS